MSMQFVKCQGDSGADRFRKAHVLTAWLKGIAQVYHKGATQAPRAVIVRGLTAWR